MIEQPGWIKTIPIDRDVFCGHTHFSSCHKVRNFPDISDKKSTHGTLDLFQLQLKI